MPTVRTVTVKSSGGDYSSLSSAEAGEQGDLVSLDRQLDIECYSMSDTAAVTVNGWTTDATRYVRIFTPSAERHDGKWNTSKYRLELNAAYVAPLTLNEAYTRVEGLQIKQTGVSGATVQMCDECVLDACIVWSSSSTSGGLNTANVAAAAACRLQNSVVMGAGGSTGVSGGYNRAMNADNCTISGWANGYSVSGAGGSAARNCYSGNNTGSDYSGGTLTTCASEDLTGTSGLRSIAYSTANFVSVTGGSEDFHLVSGSALIDVGTDLSATFTTDIDGATRSGTWDIGADEYAGAAATKAPPAFRRPARWFKRGA